MRSERHHIKRDSGAFIIADVICMATCELRNECIRIIQNHFDLYGSYNVSKAPQGTYPCSVKFGQIFSLSNLFQILKDSDFMFRSTITSKVMKKVMNDVHNDYKSYMAALKTFFKGNKFYKKARKPSPPQIKKGGGRYRAVFEFECISTTLNSGYITIGGNSFIIDIPNIHELVEIEYVSTDSKGEKTKKKVSEIKEVILKPTRNGYEIKVNYEKFDEGNKPKLVSNKFLGVDIGINCLLALTSNHLGWTPTMIKGGRLKNIITDNFKNLKHYRKRLKKKSNKKSKRINNMLFNFHNKKLDYCHKLSRMIVNIALENNFSKIVIGYNKFWKQESKLGQKTKLFQSIPYDDIIFMIDYKASEEGIEVIRREESYTSKLSFLDLDCFNYQYSVSGGFRGKNSERSIYKSKNHGIIHSDINGSYNILRKELGNNVFDLKNIEKYKKSPTNLDVIL